jgi:hypothetical protein
MFLAAAAALSLSMGIANAGELEGVQPYTEFQQLPGVIAMAPEQNPSVATAQNGQAHIYATQSNRGTWLYQGGGSHQGANS